MPKVTCPDCDEVFKVADDERASVRCPSCGTRIGRKQSDDDDEPEERERRPPRLRKSRRASAAGSGRIEGLIPLIIMGPVGVGLAITGIFNVKAAFAGTIVGFIGVCVAVLMLRSLYKREGEEFFEEGQPESWGMFISRIGLAFRRPRTFGAWTFLEVIFAVILFEGLLLVVILPKLGIHPHPAPANNAPEDQQQPGGGPNPQAGPNPPAGGQKPPVTPADNDRAITQALEGLDNEDGFARQVSAHKLAAMQPKSDRQAEVVKKLYQRLNDKVGVARIEVVLALGVWGGPDDLPTLIPILDDPDASTRSAAAKAVTRFRDVRAIPGLIRCLKDPWPDVPTKALVDIGSPAEKDLIRELANKESLSRTGAVNVLKEIGTADSLPTLRTLLNEPRRLVQTQTIQEAIKRINARAKKDAGK